MATLIAPVPGARPQRGPRHGAVLRWAVLLVLGLYFLLPLVAMLDFSTRSATGRSGDAWAGLVTDPDIQGGLSVSLQLAVLTVALTLTLLVPTITWAHLRVGRVLRVIEFFCLLPLAVPAIVIVAGIAPVYALINRLLGDSPLTLTFVYVILALPFAYRAIEAGFRTLDAATLADAARGLGCSWAMVILRVIVPNLRVALLSAAVITIALVLGEFTISSLLSFNTLQVVINLLGKRDAQISVAISLASLLFGFILLVSISFTVRSRSRGSASPRPGGAVTKQGDGLSTGGRVSRSGVEVQLVDLHRSYGSVQALKGLTLRLAPGELVALLGPSGCGKTTALRALAGLEQLDSGKILIGGKDIAQVPVNKRNMGMVFQAYSLFPNLTARENVAFGLRLRHQGAAERNRRVDDLLDLVELGSHANHYPHQLSGGQQQRVALARALAIQPTVLLLDEPLSALDAKVRAQLRDEIRRIQLETGVTTLFVTHDQEEALAMADRVGVMLAGGLEQIATPGDLYERPRTPFVAEFVGMTSRVRGVATGSTAEVLGGRVPLLDGSVTSGEALVLVRPEAVVVTLDEDGSGRVLSGSYLGAFGRVRVALVDGAVVTAQVPSSDVERLAPGRHVRLTVLPTPALAIRA